MQIETLSANPPATSASNETSVVQFANYENHKVLLTSDAGPEASTEAANYACRLGMLIAPDVIQMPHQGSRRNVTPAVLNAWLGQPNGGSPARGHAYVTVGAQKPDHPQKKVKNAFIRRGYPVLCWSHRLDADLLGLGATRNASDTRVFFFRRRG